jgi:hypothetical protein
MVHLVSTKRIDLMGKRELQAAQTFKDESPTAITHDSFVLPVFSSVWQSNGNPREVVGNTGRVLKTLASAGSTPSLATIILRSNLQRV